MPLPKRIAIAMTLLSAALAQAQSMKDTFTPAKYEFDLFSGAQLFRTRPDPLQTKLLNSIEFGTHVTENLWRHWSLEQSFSGTTLADLTLLPAPGLSGAQRVDLEQRVWKLGLNPVYHLTPLGSRIRPFLTLGFSEVVYQATRDGRLGAALVTPIPVSNYNSNWKPALNYGGGVKARLTDLIGLRFDVRGLWSKAPTWELPNSAVPAGALFIPKGGSMHGMEATGGIGFNFGGRTAGSDAAPSRSSRTFELGPMDATSMSGSAYRFRTVLTDSANAPNIVYNWTVDGTPSTTAVPTLDATLAEGAHEIKVTAKDPKTGLTTSPSATSVTVKPAAAARTFDLSAIEAPVSGTYAGDPFTFRTRLSDSANAPGIVYAWTIDGAPQSGSNGPELRAMPTGEGAHEVKVTAKDPATGTTASASPYTFTLRPVPPLTITDASDKAELKAGETARLSAQGSESDYSGPLTYTWKTSLGEIKGTGPGVTFDSSTVPFDPANAFKPESRAVIITPTVTDQRGRTASGAPIQIRVSRDPKAVRLDDLVYGNMSARVNNCAKRILIDELQALMNNNPEVEVLLIGHVDKSELRKGHSPLDQSRVNNAAAVMTAGTGVCAKCDLNRIKVSYAGTDQTSEFRSGFCGTSTRQKSEERKADDIAADDESAKNRRVEIWVVPAGVPMPAGAKNPHPAPVKLIKAKGCPK